MTAGLTFLLVGGLLVAAGAIAFGRAGRTAGLAIAGTGLMCGVAGLILLGGEGTGAKAGPVRATIRAELEPDEVSEEIRVFLDGRDAGVVRVDARAPVSDLAVSVDRVGRHAYRLESVRQKKGKRPEQARRTDKVAIADRSRLGIFYGPDGKVYLLGR
jgi:hypothetical protein